MENFKILSIDKVNELPISTGVYCFLEKNKTIYIGKAINIKDRVKNHFSQPTYKDNFFIKKIKKIGFIETNSEIEALILEANLIKKYQPKFNVVWRDDKNYFYVAITKSDCPIVYITHQRNNLKTNYIGPFVEGTSLKKTLKYLRRVFPYYTTSKHSKNKCTWCHLDLCPSPNPNLKEYKKNIKKLTLILQGKRKIVLNSLKKEMQEFSKSKDFEKALKIRDEIFALQQVMAHTNVINQSVIIDGRRLLQTKNDWHKTEKILQGLINSDKKISKIECYDISNIQGKYATGSMVVFVNGKQDKSQYKKFKIKMKNEPNDIAMLSEILKRRLAHVEWKYPEVILIDGGIAQLNIGIKSKNANPKTKKIKIISIAKGKRELIIEDQKQHIPLKNLPQEIFNLIIGLDDEAHRFAITYHKKLRRESLLLT